MGIPIPYSVPAIKKWHVLTHIHTWTKRWGCPNTEMQSRKWKLYDVVRTPKCHPFTQFWKKLQQTMPHVHWWVQSYFLAGSSFGDGCKGGKQLLTTNRSVSRRRTMLPLAPLAHRRLNYHDRDISNGKYSWGAVRANVEKAGLLSAVGFNTDCNLWHGYW